VTIVIVGLEEVMEIEDFGFRTRMIAAGLGAAPWVDTLVQVCSPESLPRRMRPGVRLARAYWDRFPAVGRFGSARLLATGERSYTILLESIVPEKLRLLSAPDRLRMAHDLRRALGSLGVRIDVLWVATPRMVDIARRQDRAILAFDCIDNLNELAEMRGHGSRLRASYEWLAAHADIVFIANENQRAMFPPSTRISVLPNGVDEAFGRTGLPTPTPLAGLPRPIIGYVGALQDRFDIGLAGEVFAALPSCSFAIVGPILVPEYEERLRRFPNVHLMGRRPHAEVPAWLQSMDAVMVPHRVNDLTDSMNPLKVYEALASGTPVVCSPISLPHDVAGFVTVAHSAEAFARALARAVETTDGQRALLRSGMAAHTWAGRMEQLKCDLEARGR
jgi:glycosyltransferase involved in cell wall biosynthesis